MADKRLWVSVLQLAQLKVISNQDLNDGFWIYLPIMFTERCSSLKANWPSGCYALLCIKKPLICILLCSWKAEENADEFFLFHRKVETHDEVQKLPKTEQNYGWNILVTVVKKPVHYSEQHWVNYKIGFSKWTLYSLSFKFSAGYFCLF